MALVVIADAGPVNYLILIGCIDLLPTLFEKVMLPVSVQTELSAPNAPAAVRNWIAVPPHWLEVRELPPGFEPDKLWKGIHVGEQSVIRLATILRADLLLMDDRKGVIVARSKGLRVTGTLDILEPAAQNNLIDLSQAMNNLRQTNFRAPDALLDLLLKKQAAKDEGSRK